MKQEMNVMDFDSHREIPLTFVCIFAIHLACLFGVHLLVRFYSMTFNFHYLFSVTKISVVVQLLLKCWVGIQLVMTPSKQRKFTFNCLLKDIRGS